MGAYDCDCINNLEYDRRERKAQLSQEGTTSDMISKFIDGLEEIFADIRERHVDDSVCGLCEYDGAYMGQSGDWCNECPGFDKDDCFKLSDETRKKWTDEIIKALPTAQPERAEGEWIVHLYKVGVSRYECDACHARCDIIYPYCPYCGEKKEGERDAIN
jgi:hypothetical protein